MTAPEGRPGLARQQSLAMHLLWDSITKLLLDVQQALISEQSCTTKLELQHTRMQVPGPT